MLPKGLHITPYMGVVMVMWPFQNFAAMQCIAWVRQWQLSYLLY